MSLRRPAGGTLRESGKAPSLQLQGDSRRASGSAATFGGGSADNDNVDWFFVRWHADAKPLPLGLVNFAVGVVGGSPKSPTALITGATLSSQSPVEGGAGLDTGPSLAPRPAAASLMSPPLSGAGDYRQGVVGDGRGSGGDAGAGAEGGGGGGSAIGAADTGKPRRSVKAALPVVFESSGRVAPSDAVARALSDGVTEAHSVPLEGTEAVPACSLMWLKKLNNLLRPSPMPVLICFIADICPPLPGTVYLFVRQVSAYVPAALNAMPPL